MRTVFECCLFVVRVANGPCAAVLEWKFRAATKNSCDAVVAKFFGTLCRAATATRSTRKPAHMARSPRLATVFESEVIVQFAVWPGNSAEIAMYIRAKAHSYPPFLMIHEISINR